MCLALLEYLFYCNGLEPNQYLRGMLLYPLNKRFIFLCPPSLPLLKMVSGPASLHMNPYAVLCTCDLQGQRQDVYSYMDYLPLSIESIVGWGNPRIS